MPVSPPGVLDAFWASIQSPGQPVIFYLIVFPLPSSSLDYGQTLSKEPLSHALKLGPQRR